LRGLSFKRFRSELRGGPSLVVDAVGATVDVVDVLVVGEAPGVDAAGDEPAALALQIRPYHDPFEEGTDRRSRQRHAEQKADGVGDQPRGEQERARGDQQATVHEFLCRHLAGGDPFLEAADGVAPLGAYQQHPDDAGEDDQRDGRRGADGVGDDDE